jgi:AcrR family transcriptional regulator
MTTFTDPTSQPLPGAVAGANAVAGAGNSRLRRDASENRERVLAAAVTAVLREGRNVPLATIAAEAHVGVGTLYRRYPNREALLADLERRAYGIVIATLSSIEGDADSGIRSIERFLRETLRHRDQLVLPFHGAPWSTGVDVDLQRRELGRLMSTLIRRGKTDGTLRHDLRPVDVIIFGALIAQPLPNATDWDAIAQSQLRIFLAGIARQSEVGF